MRHLSEERLYLLLGVLALRGPDHGPDKRLAVCCSYKKALKLGSILISGSECTIEQAPEPETLIWEHLQYNAVAKKRRRYSVNC